MLYDLESHAPKLSIMKKLNAFAFVPVYPQ